MRHPGGWLLSLSPEQFFTIRGRRHRSQADEGHRGAGHDPAADAAAVRGLAADPKQRAENLMIVDLLRNDLARIAEAGSVDVPELFEVESFPTVHQMVSRVTARLRDGADAIAVIETIFPCGSITGAPKIAAMRGFGRARAGAARGLHGQHGLDRAGRRRRVQCAHPHARAGGNSHVARLGLGSGLVVDSIAAR